MEKQNKTQDMEDKTIRPSDLLAKLACKRGNISNREEFVGNWYLARAYVDSELSEQLCRFDEKGKVKEPLHLTVDGASPMMCAIVRELILRAHYYDFIEPADNQYKKNPSLITILCKEGLEQKVEEQLLSTPFLGNYLHYCWEEPLDFLDVDVELKAKTDGQEADITEDMVKAFANAHTIERIIDTRLAEDANSIYCIGKDLKNLPDISPTDVKMYEIPLLDFDVDSFEESTEESWNQLYEKEDWPNILSNVFCTDTLQLRKVMLEREEKDPKQKKSKEQLIEDHILELSRSEHSRWVAEKLIMEFKPWTAKHHYEYSILFGDAKKAYEKSLKKQKIHLDICSYHDLCRLDPSNRKFDTFLILTMLQMLKEKEADNTESPKR